METGQADLLQPESRTRSGRAVRAPKRYVPIETPLDDFSDSDSEDVLRGAADGEGEGEIVIACGSTRPLKRCRYNSDSDEESEEESDTGSDLEGFIVDDEDDDKICYIASEDEEELVDSDADSDY